MEDWLRTRGKYGDRGKGGERERDQSSPFSLNVYSIIIHGQILTTIMSYYYLMDTIF